MPAAVERMFRVVPPDFLKRRSCLGAQQEDSEIRRFFRFYRPTQTPEYSFFSLLATASLTVFLQSV